MTFLIFAFLFQSTASLAKTKTAYRAVIVSTLPAPLIIRKEKKISGVVRDYTLAIADELHIKVKIDLLPRLRIDNYKEENYDLNCYTSHAWNDHPEAFLWSRPVFLKKEIIVGTSPLPASLNEFKGDSIGTMRGYKYPALDKLFAEKKLKREDAELEETNFTKLVNGRIPFIITDDMLLNYYKKMNPAYSKKIRNEVLIESEFPIQCAVHRKSSLLIDDVNKAIGAIIVSGKLNYILEKYK